MELENTQLTFADSISEYEHLNPDGFINLSNIVSLHINEISIYYALAGITDDIVTLELSKFPYPKPTRGKVLLNLLSKRNDAFSSLHYLANVLHKRGQQRLAADLFGWIKSNSSFSKLSEIEENLKNNTKKNIPNKWISKANEILQCVCKIRLNIKNKTTINGVIVGDCYLLTTLREFYDYDKMKDKIVVSNDFEKILISTKSLKLKLENSHFILPHSGANYNLIDLFEDMVSYSKEFNYVLIKLNKSFPSLKLNNINCTKYDSVKNNLNQTPIFNIIDKCEESTNDLKISIQKAWNPIEKVANDNFRFYFVSIDEKGSYGSPIFSEYWSFIGLIHGTWTQQSESKYYIHYGTKIEYIINDILQNLNYEHPLRNLINIEE